MRIMVDLDRVVFDCPSFMFWIGNKIFTRTHKNNELTYTEINEEKAMNYFNSLFFLKMSHSKNFKQVDKSVEILKKWYEQGFDIYFVSSRPKFKALQKTAVEWLQNHDVKYSKLIFSCSNKAMYCKENNIDLIVDDTFDNCQNTAQLGIPAVWVRNKYNENEYHTMHGIIFSTDSWRKIDRIAQEFYRKKYLLDKDDDMNKKVYVVGDIEREMQKIYGEVNTTAQLPMQTSKFNDDVVEIGDPEKIKLTFSLKSKKGIFPAKSRKIEIAKSYSMIESLQDGTPIIKNLTKTSSKNSLLDDVFINPDKVKKLFVNEEDLLPAIAQYPELRNTIDAINSSTPNPV